MAVVITMNSNNNIINAMCVRLRFVLCELVCFFCWFVCVRRSSLSSPSNSVADVRIRLGVSSRRNTDSGIIIHTPVYIYLSSGEMFTVCLCRVILIYMSRL
jgi:hypothetical protein